MYGYLGCEIVPNTGTVATKFFTCYWEKLHSNHLQELKVKTGREKW